MTEDVNRCSKTIYTRGLHFARPMNCSRKGAVLRKGLWYCLQHDPERRQAAAEARQSKFDAKLKKEREITKRGEQLARRLGVTAQVYYYSCGSVSDSGYRESLVIPFTDIEQVLKRLKK